MSKLSILRALTLGLVCIAATPAYAAITYNLKDVTFSGGGAMEGWFSLSDDYSTLEDFSFSVPSAGMTQVVGDQLFTMPSSRTGFTFDPTGKITADNSKGYTLTLNFSEAFASGNSLQLSGQMKSRRPVKPGHATSWDISGGTAIPAVPEPAAWALMILGFGVTGAMVRRKRQASRLALLPA